MEERKEIGFDRYRRKTLMMIRLDINRNTEPELAAKIESMENRASYIKRLIREDIAREAAEK